MGRSVYGTLVRVYTNVYAGMEESIAREQARSYSSKRGRPSIAMWKLNF